MAPCRGAQLCNTFVSFSDRASPFAQLLSHFLPPLLPSLRPCSLSRLQLQPRGAQHMIGQLKLALTRRVVCGAVAMGKRKAQFKLYAVRVGRRTGIFHSWDDCVRQVHGFSGAQFKSFGSQAQAEAYLDSREGQRAEAAAPVCLPAGVLPGADSAQQSGEAPAATGSGAAQLCSLISPRLRYRLEWDGGARGNPGPAGAGAVLYEDASSTEVGCVCITLGRATNNVAEYRGLLAGLQAARDLGVRRLLVTGDSMLVVTQVTGRWQVHHPGLQPLHRQAMELKRSFEEFTISHMPRSANKVADALSNVAMDGDGWEGLRDPQAQPNKQSSDRMLHPPCG